MSRKDDFRNVPRFCVMCQTPIPPERKADSVTCSKDCSVKRKNYFRSRIDQKECRYCQRPSTPEERARYLRWRRAEKKAEELGASQPPPQEEQA
jgi:tRNA(Ile)-lysidine synthase TilS/MesJ